MAPEWLRTPHLLRCYARNHQQPNLTPNLLEDLIHELEGSTAQLEVSQVPDSTFGP